MATITGHSHNKVADFLQPVMLCTGETMEYCLRPATSLLILFITGLLTACGFHLRGQMDIHSDLATLSVTGTDISYVRQLTRALTNSGFKVIPDAPYRLNVLNVSQKTNSRNQATEGYYEIGLEIKVTYQLATEDNLPLFAPVTLTAERDVSENKNLVNASSSENSIVYQELRENLLSQITRKIAAIPNDQLQLEVAKSRKMAQQKQQHKESE
ncbi:MAG: hypothetical protein PUP46_08065 [Endozoicomonas sp. (ex Botrylloides leachii)]|nr:hypothetical protein [Endozoicomonas sp. (ex Botrylloides leachii)]